MFSLAILACGLSASLASMHLMVGITLTGASLIHISNLLPFIFSIVTMVGYLRKKTSVIDAGIIMSILTHSFINRNLSLSIFNIVFVVSFLFMFIGIWTLSKYLLTLQDIEDSTRKGSRDGKVISFTKSARTFIAQRIFLNVLLGAFLSIIATLMGSYGSLGKITAGRIETILMIVFTFALFFVVYKMISLLAAEEE